MQSRDESKDLPVSYPKTLGEILDVLPSPDSMDSTSTMNSAGSLITTSPREKRVPIGRPLSEHGLETLRNIARNVSSGTLLDDRGLEMLLEQHFGSSRFVSKPRLKHVYGEDGYDAITEGYEISLDGIHDSEMKIFEALEYFNKAAPSAFVTKQIARLQAVMARRSESNEDLAVVVDTYTEHLEQYPPDVIATVCREIIVREKWFPLVSEIVKRCDKMMLFRRAVWKCFQDARNPLLAKTADDKRLETDPRLQENWRDLKRSDWLPQHYEWAITECEEMLALAKQYPHAMNVGLWEQKIIELRAQQVGAQ